MVTMMLMSMILFASNSKAQYATLIPLTAGDTITNTGSASKLITLTAGYSGVCIMPAYKKISGTNAGNIVLYQSLNNVDFRSTGDTLKLSTDSVAVWNKASPVPVYYKVQGTGSGSMAGWLRVHYVARKNN